MRVWRWNRCAFSRGTGARFHAESLRFFKRNRCAFSRGICKHRGTTSKFYHGDALGSTMGVTDTSQAVTDTVLYDGFGMTVSRTGTTPTPFGFVGKGQYQTDSDSGLQLLGHRYYDANVGRFISSDPAKAGNNWYAYCDNDPLSRTDPTGLQGPPMSTVTTPHGQLEMAEIAAEAAEGIPKPVFPTSPVFTQMGKSAMGKVVIGWGATAGTAAADAIKAAINLRAADIMRMMNAGMTSAYARQLADFYYKQWQFMLQQNASNTAITVPLERFRLMELIAHRLEFIERIQNH